MSAEKEKMATGELYDANNAPELLAERNACKVLCLQYNSMPYEATAVRVAVGVPCRPIKKDI